MAVPSQSPEEATGGDLLDSFLKEAAEVSEPAVVMAPWPTLRSGQTLADRFLIEGLARRGGMGAIYRAKDIESGVAVAIKVVGCIGESFSSRFAREGLILAQLTHPGIVRYLGHGTIEGTPYLAMEWLEGEDLSERLSRTLISVDDSLALVRHVCEALATAHERGIVHRDIKPSNLFLTEERAESVKILDFGIARLTGAVHALTGARTLLGTVGYMAPEQAMCEEHVDARADVFAIGCVLYECLTGRAPFESPHPVAVLAKVLRDEPPPPSSLNPAVDPRFDAFVSRLLAKKREQRPENAAAVLETLNAVKSGAVMRLGTSSRRTQSGLPRTEQKVVSLILGEAVFLTHTTETRAGEDGRLRELATKFSAELAQLQGGAILLVLSGRGEADDRAAQAAHCALAIRQARPDLRLAVATGLAETGGQIPVGAAIDRAASLLGDETRGSPGVYLDDLTVGLIGVRFQVERKGQTNELVGERRERVPPRLLMGKPTPCVGRNKELRLLEATLDECTTEGISRLVLVTGPPGIGKSRLAAEWLARSRVTALTRTFVARSEPMTTGSSLALVQHLIRDAAGVRDAEPLENQRGLLREYVERTVIADQVEWLNEFLGEIIGAPAAEPSTVLQAARNNPEIMREQIRRALEAWIDAETRGRSVVLILEDLHWADTPSVAFLTAALRSSSSRSLMVLALARPEVEQHFPELCQEAALQIRLPGLTARASEQLMLSALEQAPDQDVVAKVVRIADGNPFYLEELIRRVAAGSTEWPATVLTMAQSRLEHLEPEARYALRVASVFGESCWDTGVIQMVGAEIDGSAMLEELAERELLLRVPESRYVGVREYRFRHALLRDAAYAMLTDDDRQESHRIAGEWLERAGEKDARLLADHFVSGGAAEQAIPWLVRAARAAVDSGDIGSAIELSKQGVKLGASGLDRGLLLVSRGYAEALKGQPDLAVLEETLGLVPEGSATWWLGLSLLILGSTATGKPDQAAAYVNLALEAPASRERAVPLGQSLVTLVGGLVLLGKGELAATMLERAAAIPPDQTGSDPVFEAFVTAARCALASVAPVAGSWRLEYAFYEGRKAADSLGNLGAVYGASMALNYLSVAAMHLGRYQDAKEACLRAIDSAQRNRAGLNEEWARLFLAKACVRLGQPEEALAALAALKDSPDWNVRQMVPLTVAEAWFVQGKLGEAAGEARQAFAGMSPRLRRLAGCILARTQLAMGAPEAALSTVDGALKTESSGGLESDIDLLTLRAEALFACGDASEARQAIVRAKDLVEHIARGIEDATLQRSFTQNVEPCARALALASKWETGGPA